MSLRDVLQSGKFAVTAEIGPPMSASAESVRKKAAMLKGHVDAVNLTDSQTAIVRLSSFASSLACMEEGVEPVMQMTCRDRNRIAMQSDILGASAFGIRNVLCISGDHQSFGNQKEAKNVYDVDPIQQLLILNRLRNGFVWGGKELKEKPDLFLGAAANPFADPFEMRIPRLAKKIAAGADFIQTQAVFDTDRFRRFMEMYSSLEQKAYLLAGVTPLKSLNMALHMKNSVSGVIIPDKIIERMRNAEDQKAEGLRICMEIIDEIKDIEGVCGIHIMAVMWESAVPSITQALRKSSQ